MSAFQVNENCTGCLACVQNCPAGALSYRDEEGQRVILHNLSRCARCATCLRVCPQAAVEFDRLLEGRWEEVVRLELVRCRVCGAPVHAAALGGRLTEKSAAYVEPFCPQHRARNRALAGRSALPKEPG